MAFRAFTGLHSGTTNQTNSISGTVPAACVAGDLLVIAAQVSAGTATMTVTSSGPTSPTLVTGPQQVTGNNDTTYVWLLPLAAGDLGATITIASTSAGYFDGLLLAMSGVQATGMVAAEGLVNSAVSSVTTPTVTTTVDGCDIVSILALRAPSATTPVATPPGTQTKDGAATTGASGALPSFSITAGHRTTPGAAGSYGGSTWTLNTPSTGVLVTVALQPVATAGTDTGLKTYYAHPITGALMRCDVFYADASGTLVQVSSKTS
jgi:hypothetical protein